MPSVDADLRIAINQFLQTQQLRWPGGKSVCLWCYTLRFDSESGQTNDLKVNIHSFPAGRSVLKGQFTCCAVRKGTQREFFILVW